MKASTAAILKGPAGYAIAIGVAGVVLYFFGSKILSALTGNKTPGTGGNGYTGGVNGALFGTSDAQTSTNLDGSQQTAYTGKGAIGTLAASENNALGGLPSTIGESLGSWWYDLLNSDTSPGSGQ